MLGARGVFLPWSRVCIGARYFCEISPESIKERKNRRSWKVKRRRFRSALEKQYSVIRKQHKPESPTLQSLEVLPKYSHDTVFNNHYIDLSKIDVYGFDFDFVLGTYTPALQPLIYNLVKEIMVHDKKYPNDFLSFEYDPAFSIRGLHFDCKRGVLLKLDFVFNINVDTVYYGRKQLQPHQVLKLYPGLHMQQQYVNQNVRHICDLFELSECTILSDIVQYFEDKDIKFDAAAVYRDVKDAVQIVHRHKLHDAIRGDIATFVDAKPELGGLLARVRSDGKSTFLLTNNNFKNVDYLMEFIVPDLPLGYSHWTELFDVLMTNADKPNFFTAADRPFRELNEKRDGLLWSPVDSLERGHVYRDGCLHEMERLTQWSQKSTLYMGDHIKNDLIDAVKHWGWRTCAIIKELDEAITCHNSLEYRRLLSYYEQVFMLHKLATRQTHIRSPLVIKLEKHVQNLTKELMWIRHPNFGCVFKSGSKETVLAYQLLRFADLYTSRVENMLQIPSFAKITPNRRLMAHDISITPNLFMT